MDFGPSASPARSAQPTVSPFEDDIPLVARLRAGDASAVAVLFDRYKRHVQNIVFHIVGAESEATDLVHDVFVTAVDDIARLRAPIALKAWLSGITVFKTRVFLRRRRYRRVFDSLTSEEVSGPKPTASPAVSAALAAAYRVLDRLPADERIPFVLRLVHEMSLEEVSAACGTSLATTKRRLVKANARFRKLAAANPLLTEWLEVASCR